MTHCLVLLGLHIPHRLSTTPFAVDYAVHAPFSFVGSLGCECIGFYHHATIPFTPHPLTALFVLREWGLFGPQNFAHSHFAHSLPTQLLKKRANLACTFLLTNKISEDFGDFCGQNLWAKFCSLQICRRVVSTG